jgi:hypothetical protein
VTGIKRLTPEKKRVEQKNADARGGGRKRKANEGVDVDSRWMDGDVNEEAVLCTVRV